MKRDLLCRLVIVFVLVLLGVDPSHADPQKPRTVEPSDARSGFATLFTCTPA